MCGDKDEDDQASGCLILCVVGRKVNVEAKQGSK